MEVLVRVPTVLRELTGGRAVLAVELEQGATVAELLDVLATAHPALERRLRDEQGAHRPHVNLFLGEQNARHLGGLAAPLAPGQEVSILAAVSGG